MYFVDGIDIILIYDQGGGTLFIACYCTDGTSQSIKAPTYQSREGGAYGGLAHSHHPGS
jgi:hypothetical protein